MSDYTPGALPLMKQTNQQRYLVFNEAMFAIDVLQTGVLDRDLTAPPMSPAEGDAYIVNGTATGAWSGKENKITFFFGGIWNFLEPELAQGDGIYVADEGIRVRWLPEGSPPAYEQLIIGDASTVSYTPAVLADWDGSADPGAVGDALDQLAERVTDLEGGSGSNIPAMRYAIDRDSTADSDPGAGLIKFNNATPDSATFVYVDDSTADSVDLSTYFGQLGQTGFMKLQSVADPGEWMIWKWTAVTDGTGYWRFAVTLMASKGVLDDTDAVLVTWDSDANTGSGGTELKGLTFTSDTGSTADSDPGNGLFKWNNGTQASATVLYFDNQTLDGVSLTTYYGDLPATGRIYLQQSDDATKWQLWKWTAVTSGSGYYKFTAALQASGGSIADDKTTFVDFKPDANTGSGSTKYRKVFRPRDNEPPTSNFATLDTRNNHPVLDFDTTTQEAAIFSDVISAAYGGGDITVAVTASLTSATSGTLGWDVTFERDGTAQDIDSDSWATAQTITAATVPGTSGFLITLSVSITAGAAGTDSLAAGEAYRLRIRRDVANDTATGDAELWAVVVSEN